MTTSFTKKHTTKMLLRLLLLFYIQNNSVKARASEIGIFVPSNSIIDPLVDHRFVANERPMNLLNEIGPHIKCGVLCGQDCIIFEVNEGSCRLFIKFISTSPSISSPPTPIAQSRFKIFAKGEVPSNLWPNPEVLIFRLDSSDGTFWPRDVLSLNKDHPAATKYSILDEMYEYRANDGHFHFKLCYPSSTNNSCYRWSQSENPLEIRGQVLPKDFNYKEGPFPQHNGFKGLSRSTPSSSLLDGDLSGPTKWFYAIGAYENHQMWNKYPGPPTRTVTLVELFLEI